MIKAVLFDIDRTLADAVDFHARAWQGAFRRFGKGIRRHSRPEGRGGDHLMPAFLSREQVAREGRRIDECRKLLAENFMPILKPFPCVRDLFGKVRAGGRKVALASAAKGGELETDKRNAGIQGPVEAETSSDDAEQSKTEPDVFMAALRRLREIEAGEAIAVGDTPYDSEASGRDGMQTIGVLSGGFPRQDPEQAGCAGIYGDAAELLKPCDKSPVVRTVEFSGAEQLWRSNL